MKIEGLDKILGEHRIFSGLDPEFLALVAGCARNKVFRQGEYLAHQGDEADSFYLVRAGHVGLDIGGPRRLRFETVGPNEVLGLSWLVPPYRWTYDAEALDEVRTIAIDGACLRAKCDADPAIGYAVFQRFVPPILDRLQAARLQILDVYGTAR